MFGFVSQRKYNQLDKKYVSAQKELDDLRKNNIIVSKNTMDTFMTDMKRLEIDNSLLQKRLQRCIETINNISRAVHNNPVNDTDIIDTAPNTTAVWIKEEGKPFICSNCGYGFWNGTDHYVMYCESCGKRMEKIVNKYNKEKE